MRRIQIQKRAHYRNVNHSGGWKPIEKLPAKPSHIDLSDSEKAELEQRRRLGMLIQEHATA